MVGCQFGSLVGCRATSGWPYQGVDTPFEASAKWCGPVGALSPRSPPSTRADSGGSFSLAWWKSTTTSPFEPALNMVLVDTQQLTRAWDAFENNDFRMKDSQGEIVSMETADERRRDRLPVLRELIEDFLTGDIELGEFKSGIDDQNKRFPYWGFKGLSGMMFFNMLYSSAGEDRRDELVYYHYVTVEVDFVTLNLWTARGYQW